MERLLKLAEKIKDKELREKTVELLKNPKVSNPSMDYKASDITKTPSWIGAHHSYKGGLLDHIVSVTELSIMIAEHFTKRYGKKINMDHLIAAALLHDISKVFQLKEVKGTFTFSDFLLDHALWTCCELYARGFPEEVIDIVISHGGENITSSPRSIEAYILRKADEMDATVESFGQAKQQILLLGEDFFEG